MQVPLTDSDFPLLKKGDLLSVFEKGKFYPVTFIGWSDRSGNGTCMIQVDGKNTFYASAKLWKFGLDVETMHEVSGWDA